MSDRFGSLWHLIARLVFVETLIPVGVAAAAGLAVAAIVPPHWRAAGLPWFLGLGKNVESAAIAAALAAGAATQLFVGTRRGLGCCALLAALGYALVAARCPVLPLVSGWPQLAAVAGLAALAGRAASASASTHGQGDAASADAPAARCQGAGAGAGSGDVPVRAALARGLPTAPAALAAAGALAVLTVAVGPPRLSIDVFHHGEVLSTAVDLLRGGRPFETLIWPHGFHDSGLAALWIRATGKVGTSPVALAWASCCALGAISAYVLARRMLASRLAALAACLAVALAPLLVDEPVTGASARALNDLGILVFVALGCAAVTSRRRSYVAAGVCCGLAYLFRIDTGVYATLAVLGVIAYRELAGTAGAAGGVGRSAGRALAGGGTIRSAGRALAGGGLRLAGGIALALGGCRLLFGWPGEAWFAYTLWDLPRFHRDAVGSPFPWPHRGVAMSLGESVNLSVALSRLLLTLLLLVQAVRAVRDHRRAGAESEPPRAATALLFVALFGAFATKSALDRSDLIHLLQWTTLPLFSAACLVVADWRDRRSWAAGRTALAAFVFILLLDFGWLGLRLPELRGAAAMAAAARERWQGFVEHLSPNQPVGGCADRAFTPGESGIDANRRFIADTCVVEGLLRDHGVHRMVVADGAPWYDVRFHLPPASRYIALARAYTPPRQLELIEVWRARPAQALLLVRGYGGMTEFDVPDAVRVPVADAYLKARREGVAATPTAVGDLFLWDEAPARPQLARAASAPPETEPAAGLTVATRPQRPLSGAEWQGLGAAIDRAAALGRADRAAALAAAGRARRPDGKP
jgi:hypothetical protein